MDKLDEQISAFESERDMLETKHMGKWVIYHDRHLIDIFDSFEAAADYAVPAFGRDPFLIRRVGAPPLVLPASIMYRVQ